MPSKIEISEELKELVFHSVKTLGEAIEEVYGKATYTEVEALRIEMKSMRAAKPEKVLKTLEQRYAKMKTKPDKTLGQISKSFSLMMELINSCEAAYRIYRLGGKKYEQGMKPYSLVFVFTSHPTEARSKNFLALMDRVEALLLEKLSRGEEDITEALKYLLKLALRLDLANNRRPMVVDEAEQIFHTVLNPKIIREQVELKRQGINVFFRTWVGGDKDGHPKVGADTLVESLSLSRARLLQFIDEELKSFKDEMKLIREESVIRAILDLRKLLPKLRSVRDGDGLRVKEFKQKLKMIHKVAKRLRVEGPQLDTIDQLLWIYPAIVLPLEIREDSELIHQALTKPSLNIAKMLTKLNKISKGMEAKWYVRGFILSMCQEKEDMIAAIRLQRKMCGSLVIPVVPLFENEKGLTDCLKILQGTFDRYDLVTEHLKKWGGRFEVMLGYSDSSKENGVLPGRLMVEKALFSIDKFLRREKLTPVFFHGSGGSVSRGGGSIKEQIAWWPESALNIFKVTIQGETVQRHFHHPLIMRSQVNKIVEGFANFKTREDRESPELMSLAGAIQAEYRKLVKDPLFQEMTAEATPYEFLSLLKIGSRPTKRSGKGKFTLRAIPWILCWTQTRLLLPFWWGTGTAWDNLSQAEKAKVKKAAKTSPLFESYLKHLGFTLAKVELGVWKFCLKSSRLDEAQKKYWDKLIESELQKTISFFREVTGEKSFTWFNPRLGDSIYFRSSMIHPLNIIQKIALERRDRVLLRETVTGIASGMLTTG
jgi:phosphoenolpyruvate carboxylase